MALNWNLSLTPLGGVRSTILFLSRFSSPVNYWSPNGMSSPWYRTDTWIVVYRDFKLSFRRNQPSMNIVYISKPSNWLEELVLIENQYWFFKADEKPNGKRDGFSFVWKTIKRTTRREGSRCCPRGEEKMKNDEMEDLLWALIKGA